MILSKKIQKPSKRLSPNLNNSSDIITLVSKEDIIQLIEKDKWMMEILKTVEKLGLPDWWIGAGFVRSKVWDYLHAKKTRTPLPDIDVIYFDKNDFSAREASSFSTKEETKYQNILSRLFPSVKWSVTNQARMHIFHKRKPYKSSEEGLSDWAETATCIGVKIKRGKPVLVAPYGIGDLVNLVLRPIPNYQEKYKHDPDAFKRRMTEKEWLKKWPKLKTIAHMA